MNMTFTIAMIYGKNSVSVQHVIKITPVKS